MSDSTSDLIDYDVYSPEPEDPSDLPAANLRAWQKGFAAAQQLYGDVAEADKACAQSAWRYVSALYEQDGYGAKRKWTIEGQRDFAPVPESFVSLGRVREIAAINQKGLQQLEWPDTAKLPYLFWCQRTREAWVIPNLELQASDEGYHPEAGVYKRWTRRKMRQVLTGYMPAEVDLFCLGIGDSISYRSDKWGDVNQNPNLSGSQEYYHMHSGNGVRVWVNDLESPTIIRVVGGWLDLHDKGLIH